MRFILLIVIAVVGVGATCSWLVWILAARPLALSLGLIQPTADDYVVRGWRAEREGRWGDALTAYNEALRRMRWHKDAKARRACLLERFPDLARRSPQTSGTPAGDAGTTPDSSM